MISTLEQNQATLTAVNGNTDLANEHMKAELHDKEAITPKGDKEFYEDEIFVLSGIAKPGKTLIRRKDDKGSIRSGAAGRRGTG